VAISAIGAAAAVGGAVTAHESSRTAKRSAKKQEEAAEELLAEEEKAREQTAFSVLKRRKSGEGSARDTILTSPLGVSGTAGQAGKKLLGE
jgi:hypothetical protein